MENTGTVQSPSRYSGVAIALHWLIALALSFQLALGFAMPKGTSGYALFQLHKSVGITILLLTLIRVGWRLTHRPPPAMEGGFGAMLAKAVHVLLYLFMIGAPLTGWALVSASSFRVPTVLFGTIPWPHLPVGTGMEEPLESIHELLAWLGLALIALHILGALRHQLLLKDGLLRRMGPGGSGALAGLLAVAVVAVYFGTGMTIASRTQASDRTSTENDAETTTPVTVAEATPTEALPTATPTEEATPEAEASATESAAAEEEPAGPPPTWTIQPGGTLAFAVGNGSDTIKGTFSDWSGTIRFDPERPDNAPDIRISIKLASASLGDATQDGMIQDSEFFGTAANPTAVFNSTEVTQNGTNRYTARGTLRLKGVSRPQTISFTLSGSGMRRKVQGTGSINRTSFKVGTGESAAGLDTSVSVNFSFDAVGK